MWYRIFKWWILLAFVATAACGLAALATQQTIRLSANNPQIQIAEDTATTLASGAATTSVVPTGTIDIARQLSPYVVIFDAQGNPIAGDGRLNGALPKLPSGVFPAAQATGESSFTWQPEPGVRSAVVIVPVINSSAGFVMAGRNIREVESLEDHIMRIAEATWLATIAGIFILLLIFSWIEKIKSK